MAGPQQYIIGDWVVHSHYGTGQIEGIDLRSISGEETSYFRIKTTDSTYWIPVDQAASELLRPLATLEEIEQAIIILQKPPQQMSANHKIRRSCIRQAQLDNTPQAIAQMIRDLRGYRREKGILNETERNAFRTLKQRLIEEWSLVTGKKMKKVETELKKLLDLQHVAAI